MLTSLMLGRLSSCFPCTNSIQAAREMTSSVRKCRVQPKYIRTCYVQQPRVRCPHRKHHQQAAGRGAHIGHPTVRHVIVFLQEQERACKVQLHGIICVTVIMFSRNGKRTPSTLAASCMCGCACVLDSVCENTKIRLYA